MLLTVECGYTRRHVCMEKHLGTRWRRFSSGLGFYKRGNLFFPLHPLDIKPAWVCVESGMSAGDGWGCTQQEREWQRLWKVRTPPPPRGREGSPGLPPSHVYKHWITHRTAITWNHLPHLESELEKQRHLVKGKTRVRPAMERVHPRLLKRLLNVILPVGNPRPAVRWNLKLLTIWDRHRVCMLIGTWLFLEWNE